MTQKNGRRADKAALEARAMIAIPETQIVRDKGGKILGQRPNRKARRTYASQRRKKQGP